MFKKGISPVVATALLLVVAVVAVTSFQSWFNNYSSATFVGVEEKSEIGEMMKVEGIVGGSLYLFSGLNQSFSSLKIVDSEGVKVCDVVLGGVSDGLVGYWSFDVDASDDSGNGNDGFVNGATHNLSGYFGGAYTFDGIDDYIEVADDASLRPQNFTITGWFYKDVTGPSHRILVSKQFGASSQNSFAVFENNLNQYSFYGRLGGINAATYAVGVDLPENVWTHFAATYNSSEVVLYLNGTEVYSEPETGVVSYDSEPVVFGADDDSPDDTYSFFWDGSIDEIRIYERALSPAEVGSLYSMSVGSGDIGSGISEFDVSMCSLVRGNEYSVVGFTDGQKVDMKVIAR